MRRTPLFAASAVALGIGILAVPGIASAAGNSYQAQLGAINGSGGSGTFMMTLNGSTATITEHVTGLAATFNGSPYPHVQHIHIGAKGVCPDTSADTSKDGVISTTEGAPFYGGIGTTLSTSGDTSPAAGTTLTVAPSGATFTYKRTFALDPATLASVKGGTAVIVVHGLDPAKTPQASQSEPSDLVPSLPLAATSPALCGSLKASQMSVPNGSAATGGGSTAGLQHEGLIAGGAGLVIAGAAAGAVAMRRRSTVTR